MSGGRFLVSLREVTNSERIIRCRPLVKADINFWKEDLGSDKPSLDFSALLALLYFVSYTFLSISLRFTSLISKIAFNQ